jgi:hypothetical protein
MKKNKKTNNKKVKCIPLSTLVYAVLTYLILSVLFSCSSSKSMVDYCPAYASQPDTTVVTN